MKPFASVLWCFFAAASSGCDDGFEGEETVIEAILVEYCLKKLLCCGSLGAGKGRMESCKREAGLEMSEGERKNILTNERTPQTPTPPPMRIRIDSKLAACPPAGRRALGESEVPVGFHGVMLKFWLLSSIAKPRREDWRPIETFALSTTSPSAHQQFHHLCLRYGRYDTCRAWHDGSSEDSWPEEGYPAAASC